eukprot:9725779-Alexandrium_andersonii.AAC.1
MFCCAWPAEVPLVSREAEEFCQFYAERLPRQKGRGPIEDPMLLIERGGRPAGVPKNHFWRANGGPAL